MSPTENPGDKMSLIDQVDSVIGEPVVFLGIAESFDGKGGTVTINSPDGESLSFSVPGWSDDIRKSGTIARKNGAVLMVTIRATIYIDPQWRSDKKSVSLQPVPRIAPHKEEPSKYTLSLYSIVKVEERKSIDETQVDDQKQIFRKDNQPRTPSTKVPEFTVPKSK